MNDTAVMTATVYCLLCTVHCALCTVYCALTCCNDCNCVLCTVYCVLCTVYCVLCTVYCVLCTVYCVLCTVHWHTTEPVLLYCLKIVLKNWYFIRYVTLPRDNTKRSFKSSITLSTSEKLEKRLVLHHMKILEIILAFHKAATPRCGRNMVTMLTSPCVC